MVQVMMESTPTPRESACHPVMFNLPKVNRLRSVIARGGYAPDYREVAESLITDHLLFTDLLEWLKDDSEKVATPE